MQRCGEYLILTESELAEGVWESIAFGEREYELRELLWWLQSSLRRDGGRRGMLVFAAVILRLRGYSWREIAERFNLKPSAVRMAAQRAVAKYLLS